MRISTPVPSPQALFHFQRQEAVAACNDEAIFQHIAALVLVAVIVITGAAVRLSGSGLGCNDWPNCNDSKLVDVSSHHAAIEQLTAGGSTAMGT